MAQEAGRGPGYCIASIAGHCVKIDAHVNKTVRVTHVNYIQDETRFWQTILF